MLQKKQRYEKSIYIEECSIQVCEFVKSLISPFSVNFSYQ